MASRQRKYQLKRVAEGKCPTCGQPTSGGYYCDKHKLKRAGYYRSYKRRKSHKEDQSV